jgi:undecaprenyl diphosphate synthase
MGGWNWLKTRAKPDAPADRPALAGLPEHVAIIMDGNGRWASERGLPRVAGHRSGMATIKRIAIAASDLGIRILTMYAFSTENWKRPKDEVDYLMRLPGQFLHQELDELMANNVRVRMMGWKEGLPAHTLAAVEEAVNRTKDNTGMILNFAFNYGGRRELLHGIRRIAELVKDGRISVEDISEDLFSAQLLSGGLPDPDLLIRTSGEQRISNFMLWQIAYAELAFVDVYWPDFTVEHFHRVIGEYQRRQRRFGAV